MARRLSRLVSIALSSALVALSFGFDAQQAAAQAIVGRGAPAARMPQLGLAIANAPAASLTLAVPTALSVIAAPVLVRPVSPTAAIAESIKTASPALQALAKTGTGGTDANVAGRDLEAALTGAKSASTSGEVPDAVAGAASARTQTLSAPGASPEAPKTPGGPPSPPAPVKSISSAASYAAHRLALKAVAALTGAVFTLPQAGPALSAKIIASASDKALVLSDFDDTLTDWNEVLPDDKIEAVRKIRAAGKHFAVISDRGDVKRPGDMRTVFESLESLPIEVRSGMYVAANRGGNVYRYDALGVPQKVHAAPNLTEAQVAQVMEAAVATKARLSEVGAVQHLGDGKNPSEMLNPYGYSIMLKPGSSPDAVRGTARILNEELAKRGFEAEVQPRFAKDPANPPYATFGIITKADAAAYIAKSLKIAAGDALVIGDAMFIPREAKRESWLTRLGERLSGRPQVKTGNETDRNMTKNLPGVLALGVGAAMDPRTPNGWALAGRGPEVTQKVLEAVASKPFRLPSDEQTRRDESYIQLGLIIVLSVLGSCLVGQAVGFLVGLAGTLQLGAKKPAVADDAIREAAKSLAAIKGGVWSYTEYHMNLAQTLETLRARGATKAQLELFRKLCEAAPVIGGRFNPWAGD